MDDYLCTSDLAQGSRETAGPGRLSRFLSDAIPSVRSGKPPIPQEIYVVREGVSDISVADQDPDLQHMRVMLEYMHSSLLL